MSWRYKTAVAQSSQLCLGGSALNSITKKISTRKTNYEYICGNSPTREQGTLAALRFPQQHQDESTATC